MGQDSAMIVDLTPFLAPDGYGRYAMDRPFVRGGWRYATNASICVRVPAPGEPNTEPGTDDHFPPCPDLFLASPSHPEYLPLPPAAYDRGPKSCDDCLGGELACLKCDGKGCSGCGWFGTAGRKCQRCDGAGTVVGDLGIRIGHWYVAAKYDRLIRSLPNPRYVANAAHGGHDPLRFAFDGGGEGVVMQYFPPKVG